VPAVVDLAAMRSAMAREGGDPSRVNPLIDVDLVIDHSVQVDLFGSADAYERNIDFEYERNGERYALLRWAQQAFDGVRVVPPGAGICHQVNLEHLGRVVTQRDGTAFPDTLVGTDSHTTMINGLGILGWGVGGIEAEAAMLGQPMFSRGRSSWASVSRGAAGGHDRDRPRAHAHADVARARRGGGVRRVLRAGCSTLELADRATSATCAPSTGPRPRTGRSTTRRCGTCVSPTGRTASTSSSGTRRAGPVPDGRRPRARLQRDPRPGPVGRRAEHGRSEPATGPRVPRQVWASFDDVHHERMQGTLRPRPGRRAARHVVIAAITSCTNTSNPSVMLAAGLLAKRAVEAGLQTKPW